jgi:hypothetical protein
MKTYKLLLAILLVVISNEIFAQTDEVKQSDIDNTCFVLTRLTNLAQKSGNIKGVIDNLNTFDQIMSQYHPQEKYIKYFQKVKDDNQTAINSFNSTNHSNGIRSIVSNKVVSGIEDLIDKGISFEEINNELESFINSKKINLNMLNIDQLDEKEKNNLEMIQKDVTRIKID